MAPHRQIVSVTNALAGLNRPRTWERLSQETGISARKLTNMLHTLEETGAARKPASGQIGVETEHSAAELTEAGLRQQDLQKALRGRRLEQMQGYAETRGCRREFLPRCFGESHSGPCGNCDLCEQSTAQHA
ncbi:MAG: RecQ family zinc-binding domain-containing protein [Acidobacteriota bacterium]